LHLIKGIC